MAITKSTPAPLTGGTLWCVTIALSLATFMQMLDSTISNVAIPTISGFLGASTDEGTWVITSFGVANAIAIPVTGRLAQRIRETETSPVKMNLPGLTLLVLGVGGLQIMLDKGRDLDWFNSSTIIILTVVSVISLISLVIWESTSENPILDLSLFKSRNFTIGIVSITCAYLFYSGAIVLMPQLLQETMGYNAIWAGLAYAPIGIMPLLISPLIGRYGNKIDMRLLVTFSFLMYAVCYYWRSVTFMPTIDFTGIILPQFFQGFAVACFFLPLTTISFSGLPDNKFANASSMSNFFRTLSGSVGTSLTMTLWGRRESLHHSQLTATIDQFNPVFNSSSQIMDKYYGSLSGVLNEINNEITQQSLSISANEIFRMAAIAFILLTVLVWFAKPPFTAKGIG